MLNFYQEGFKKVGINLRAVSELNLPRAIAIED